MIREEDSARGEPLFASGLERFHRLAKLEPNGVHRTGGTLVATFPSYCESGNSQPQLSAGDSGIVRSTSAWACGAGSYFHRGCIRDAVLRCLVEHIQDHPGDGPDNQWLHDLDGSFAIVGGDERDSFVIADRAGTIHVYWGARGSTLLVSTSSRSEEH